MRSAKIKIECHEWFARSRVVARHQIIIIMVMSICIVIEVQCSSDIGMPTSSARK